MKFKVGDIVNCILPGEVYKTRTWMNMTVKKIDRNDPVFSVMCIRSDFPAAPNWFHENELDLA